MSRVPWHLFQDRKPHAHLVVGAIVQASGPVSLNDSTVALAVLRRLARKQKPIGDYAATVVREAGWAEVYFAFADEADAQKFGASVQAGPIASYPGWASQRAFKMDSARIRERAMPSRRQGCSLNNNRRITHASGVVGRKPASGATTSDRRMPTRNPLTARYVVEIRDATGASLLLTRADWTDSERDLAISAVLRLVGMKSPSPG
jgi:hypothetical protein